MSRYSKSKKDIPAKDFIDRNGKKINWSRNLIKNIEREKTINFDDQSITPCLYRPFTLTNVYFNKNLIEYIYQNNLIKGLHQKDILIWLRFL